MASVIDLVSDSSSSSSGDAFMKRLLPQARRRSAAAHDLPDPVLVELLREAYDHYLTATAQGVAGPSNPDAAILRQFDMLLKERIQREIDAFRRVQQDVLGRKVPILFEDDDHPLWSKQIVPEDFPDLKHDPSKRKYKRKHFQADPILSNELYPISDVLYFVDAKTNRYVFYHGTRLEHLVNMIEVGAQPIGGSMLGKGFYVTPDPNVPRGYANKAEKAKHALDHPVIVQFSIAPSKAKKLMGRMYRHHQPPTHDNGFFQSSGAYLNYFNFHSADAIRRLRMDAIHVRVNGGVPDQYTIDRIRTAQQTAKYVRPNSSDSNSNARPSKRPKKDDDKDNSLATLKQRQADLMQRLNDARSKTNVRSILTIQPQLDEVVKEIKRLEADQKKKSPPLPQWLSACDPTLDVPTKDGDVPLAQLIKDPKQLFVVNGACYDLVSLYEIIQHDISQGNVWGTDPYARRLGLMLPFDRNVKDDLMAAGKQRGLLPANARWVNHTPESADDVQMRGSVHVSTKKTPDHWVRNGWSSIDGSAFPTSRYYAVRFAFPNRGAVQQTPGTVAIFPHTTEAKKFIDQKLLPVFRAGALWSKSLSATLGATVINPNVHLVFEDNQPQRWSVSKMADLETEILKFRPAFA